MPFIISNDVLYTYMYICTYACEDQKHDQSDVIIQSAALTIGMKWNSSEPQLRRTSVVLLAKGEQEPEDPSLPRCATQASDRSLPLKQVFLIQRLCSYALHVCKYAGNASSTYIRRTGKLIHH